MFKGCDHCGTVVQGHSTETVVNCPECGRPLRKIDAFEARSLTRERRIAEQFQRVTRLRYAMDARRVLKAP
jgi:predicted RNA-binding Zn-ribbon protein involved in translation (DUF1610 family)